MFEFGLFFVGLVGAISANRGWGKNGCLRLGCRVCHRDGIKLLMDRRASRCLCRPTECGRGSLFVSLPGPSFSDPYKI